MQADINTVSNAQMQATMSAAQFFDWSIVTWLLSFRCKTMGQRTAAQVLSRTQARKPKSTKPPGETPKPRCELCINLPLRVCGWAVLRYRWRHSGPVALCWACLTNWTRVRLMEFLYGLYIRLLKKGPHDKIITHGLLISSSLGLPYRILTLNPNLTPKPLHKP